MSQNIPAINGTTGSFSGSFTVPNNTLQGEIVAMPNVTSVGAAAEQAGVIANLVINDTSNHSIDGSHVIGVLGISTAPNNSQIVVYGVEGRANVLSVAPQQTGSVINRGTLGYCNAFDASSRGDNNWCAGLEGRSFKTTATDGTGSPIATGTVMGLLIHAVAGGGLNGVPQNFGIYQDSGTYNILQGWVGIGTPYTFSNVPLAPLSVDGFNSTFNITGEFLSGGSSNPMALALGRTAADAYFGISGGGSFISASSAGDTILRAQGANIWMTGNSNGTTNGLKINSTDGTSLQALPGATIRARTPGNIGELLQCQDCAVPYTTCVATATAQGAYSLTGAAKAVCQ